jgi:predicted transposase YbfD/YdcC
MEIGLPHVRTLVVVEKTSTSKNGKPKTAATADAATVGVPTKGDATEVEETVSYYLSCHHPRRAEFFAELIRGHWGGCEIRNHWVRDAIFDEDSTRSKNVNLNGNLAILRGALITLKARLVPDRSWPFIRELSSMKISLPYNMICKNLFK